MAWIRGDAKTQAERLTRIKMRGRIVVRAIIANIGGQVINRHVLNGFQAENTYTVVAAAFSQHIAKNHAVHRARQQSAAAGEKSHTGVRPDKFRWRHAHTVFFRVPVMIVCQPLQFFFRNIEERVVHLQRAKNSLLE